MNFDNIKVGQIIDSLQHVMELPEIKAFAASYDPQPMHLDEVAATKGPFGELTASGWHTLSVTMKLMTLAKPFGETQLVGVGVDGIEFKRPVYPGDTLVVRATVVNKRMSTKPGRAFVELKVETRDLKNNEIVVRQNWTVMIPA